MPDPAAKRLTIERLLSAHPQQFAMEWHMVGLELGLVGRVFARCWIGSSEALRWNAFRILGFGR
jgi:hypothetical protein